jgi:hypothetical protein
MTALAPDSTLRSGHPEARDPRREAEEAVGPSLEARVLEPSPPTVDDAPWLADDPVGLGAERRGPRVVSPVGNGDLRWDDWLADHPGRAAWAGERWLGAYGRLPEAPTTLAATRLAAQRLAVYVVAPARRRVNGKIGLRWTLGGFGTPFFGADEQVRLVGTVLVRQRGDAAAAEHVGTLARAAAFALDGHPDLGWPAELGLDVPPPGALDADLELDHAAAAFLGDWFGFGASVLEELRAEPGTPDPGRVQLWPEHFDLAVDCAAPAGRATFGASPGDEAIAEPYLYALSPAAGLTTRPLRAFLDAPDQRAAALAFLRERRDALVEDPG